MSTCGRKTFAASALAALTLVLAWAPVARADAVPVGDGETTLKLSARVSGELRRDGIRLLKVSPGRVQGRTVTVPVTGGTLDAPQASADLSHGGGFKLQGPRRTAVLRKLVLDLPAKELRGRIGGRQLTIASLSKPGGGPDGFGARIAIPTLKLTPAAALALDRALSLDDVFAAGQSLGSLTSLVQPRTVTVASGTIGIGGEASTFAKLESQGVEIGVSGTSSRFGESGPPVFLFEIAGGSLAPDGSSGRIEGEGDLTLQRPQPYQDLLLSRPTVELGSAGVLSAGLSSLSGANLASGAIATLDTGAATTRIRGADRMEVNGVSAIATPFLADRLNATFAPATPFLAGEPLGKLSLTLYTR